MGKGVVEKEVHELLSSFYIGAYRGLKDVEFHDFSDVNIFVGKNNAGKTSVLEAMILSGLFDDGKLLIQTIVSRYQQISMDFIKTMFPGEEDPLICLKRKMKEQQQVVHTHVTYEEEEKTILKDASVEEERRLYLKFNYNLEDIKEKDAHVANYAVRFTQHGSAMSVDLGKSPESEVNAKIPCEFISFSRFDRTNYLINALDSILEQDKRAALIQVLQIFDPDVKNFEVIGKERNIKIFTKDRERPLSLYDYGNGMYKAFYIASAALLSENGILLIDEIEAGIHKEALRKFIDYLLKICSEKNIQLFITTHSLETIDVLLECREEELGRIAAYNMRKTEDKTIVRRFGGKRLLELRQEMGLDIR